MEQENTTINRLILTPEPSKIHEKENVLWHRNPSLHIGHLSSFSRTKANNHSERPLHYSEVIDDMGGLYFLESFQKLERGGRYVLRSCSTLPPIAFDLRTLYLNDLQIITSVNSERPKPSFHKRKAFLSTNQNDLQMTRKAQTIPKNMWAVVTTGHGGYEKLKYCQVECPQHLEPHEVLIQVLAAGANNTEINTRLGWYSQKITTGTNDLSSPNKQAISMEEGEGGWNEQTPFPFIQGTDCCGNVVALGSSVDPKLLHQRALIRPCMRKRSGFQSLEHHWMGSDFHGSFAQYVKVPAKEVFAINSYWKDEELASIPCAYGTAENMLIRSNVKQDERVLITGASGGVGSASLQLARCRGAKVTAICGSLLKAQQIKRLGAHEILVGRPGQEEWNPQALKDRFDVVIDNVGGNGFGDMISALTSKGRYVTSGAIGGPIVNLDLKTITERSLSIIGCTVWDEATFPNLIQYIEKDEIVPLIAKTYPLKEISQQQEEFLRKTHVGKFVLIPPA